MKYVTLDQPIHIIGIEIRTSNENGKAFIDIPPHWEKFYKESLLDQIPNKISDEVYGIYTKFEHEDNNEGTYSFIIGAPVKNVDKVAPGFVSVTLPASTYQVFSVKKGHPEKVGEKWQEIWNHKFEKQRTFLTEFERYMPDGAIDIFIGVK